MEGAQDGPATPPLGRAHLVATLAVYAALALGVAAVSRALAGDRPAGTAAVDFADLLPHVHPGMSFETWTIVHVGPPERGALPVTLRGDDGPDLTLTLTRRAPEGPRPLAGTDRFAVFRAPSAPSDSLTPDREIVAAAALAAHLRAREAPSQPSPPAGAP